MSWDNFYTSFKRAAGAAADKINQTADLATLQVKQSLAEHKLNEAYALLGRAAYRHFAGEDSEVDSISVAMTTVEEAQKTVDDLTVQIEKRKAESNKQ